MTPKICVAGATKPDAVHLLEILCEANPDDIYRRRVDVGIMTDGTELIAISLLDMDDIRGRTFDYVFYEDTNMLLFCIGYSDAIEYLEKNCLVRSIVPREFQWCAVEA